MAGPGAVHRGAGGRFRSYDHRGAAFHWHPPAGLAYQNAALDVEARDAPGITSMSERFGLVGEAFLKRWTSTEALAKVLDWPILDFIRTVGLAAEAPNMWSLDQSGAWVRSIEHPTHWVAVALTLPAVKPEVLLGHPDGYLGTGVAGEAHSSPLPGCRQPGQKTRS